MKKVIVASIAIIALGSSAMAADMGPPPVYKAPPPPPPSWTGCYVNGGVGGGIWNAQHHLETFPGLTQLTADTDSAGQGWLGTVGGGCDFQFNAFNTWNVVIGAFGDFDLMDLHGDVGSTFSGVAFFGDATERSAWAGGLRAGLLVTPTLLTYVNGGYTGTHAGQVNLSLATLPLTSTGIDIPAHNYNGWFIGGGTEYALTWSWLPIHGLFWRNEYRYSSYQAADQQAFLRGTGLPFATHADLTVQTITSSLVWRFNWTGH